jgi:hypothetical protein
MQGYFFDSYLKEVTAYYHVWTLNYGSQGLFGRCKIVSNIALGFGLYVCNGSLGVAIYGQPSVFEGTTGAAKAYQGAYGMNHSQISFETSYNTIRNWVTGVVVDTGSQVSNSANTIYATNDANEVATAASYGYID